MKTAQGEKFLTQELQTALGVDKANVSAKETYSKILSY
jgi:hypothetical protein